MVGLPFAGDGLVHAGLSGLEILAALLFYAYEKRRRGLSDPRLWPLAGFAVASYGTAGHPVTSYAVFRFGVEFGRGNVVLWLGMSRPQGFLLMILPLLFWRVLRVFGRPFRRKVEGGVS